MKTLKSILSELVLPFFVAWFFMTVLVDIVAVPTVFKYTSNLQEAGKIGMTVFHRFNCFEIFFGVITMIGIFVHTKSTSIILKVLSVLLVLNALFYTFYMTPMIANLAVQMHSVAPTDSMYAVYRSEHAKFHNLYRYFDTTKLIVLLVMIGLMMRLNLKNKN